MESFEDCPSMECELSLTRCWTGECLIPSACPPLPSCPSTAPGRCADGRCIENPTFCSTTTLPSCPLGTRLCPTGMCQRECTPVSGCAVNEAMCSNGECVTLLPSDLSGSSNYTDRCFTSARAGSSQRYLIQS